MNFYKLALIEDGKDIYVNPNSIMCYCYEDDNNVNILLNGGEYVTVNSSDFTDMMFFEGAREYWHTQHTIEFLLTIKTISFY